jgi:hypothetical protein
MTKTLVHITTQYSENYGTSENPHWKFKGENKQLKNIYEIKQQMKVI